MTAHQVSATSPFDREVWDQPAWRVLVELSRAGSGVTGIAIAAVAASRLPASRIPNVRRIIFSAIPEAQITILNLVASITKNVHWSGCAMTHRVNRRLAPPGDATWPTRPWLPQEPASIAIKTMLAFDGRRMIKSLIGMPALLGDT